MRDHSTRQQSRFAAGHGYILVHLPRHPLANSNGYVYEHRLVAYETYGPLPAGAVVHHRDGNKMNNAPENLEVMSKRAHAQLHMANNAYAARPPLDRWSLRYDCCQGCGSTLRRHVALGLCTTCHARHLRALCPGPGRARGERVPGAKLTDEQVRSIYSRVHAGETCAALAREFGVRYQSISAIKLGKKWRHITRHPHASRRASSGEV